MHKSTNNFSCSISLVPQGSLLWQTICLLHFTDEEIDAQRIEINCSIWRTTVLGKSSDNFLRFPDFESINEVFSFPEHINTDERWKVADACWWHPEALWRENNGLATWFCKIIGKNLNDPPGQPISISRMKFRCAKCALLQALEAAIWKIRAQLRWAKHMQGN